MRRMLFGWVLVAGTVIPAIAHAQAQPELASDQKGYIIYDRCMMQAAIAASRTDAKDEAIFGMAKTQCAATRSQVITGQEGNREFLAALDAADADKAARFPEWINGVRERRRQRDAEHAAPGSATSK